MKTKLLLFYLINALVTLILFRSCDYLGDIIINEAASIKSLLMFFFVLGLIYSIFLDKYFRDVLKD